MRGWVGVRLEAQAWKVVGADVDGFAARFTRGSPKARLNLRATPPVDCSRLGRRGIPAV